ncbi:diguanylate cyclase [Noviherbaspirillum humi]|uniref:diguanylate cyclase n=1 Tax=Noviherbaspirillum humi TaxID=1688639 RepID=A0A239FYX7_9BURK|nr:GGDEF domain-containing protein [Noviherbaspirillum humi]SNS61990.1 diguanylate cyclase [Noviherbaspirillum humi]
MEDKPPRPESASPAEIAREAFRRLATRRIAPTPDAYRRIYEEIAGVPEVSQTELLLADLAQGLKTAPAPLPAIGSRLANALEQQDWEEYASQMAVLLKDHLQKRPAPVIAPVQASSTPSIVIDGARSAALGAEPASMRMLRDLLARTLTLAIGSLLQDSPELVAEADNLAETIKRAATETELNDAGGRLKQLCFRIELKSGDRAEQHELLLQLFRLLLENIGELIDDDSWLRGQVAGIQDLLSGPISHGALLEATRSMKDVIYKQGALKHSLSQTKAKMKDMMLTFIDRLGQVAASTGDYHEKIDRYSQKISTAKDIAELNVILDDVMRETRNAQSEALRSRDQMLAARQEAHEAETRIHELESKLQEMSELVREDALTGSLNRRGLDDVFDRELARAQRKQAPLCIALLDLDDFKRLNDTHGHSAGDQVLVHLVRVIKDTLRTMDVIARFGGEEFLIVLPDTPLDAAAQTVTRVQRELTKRIFMYNNERLLITFSAGVAMLGADEDQRSVIIRADKALYKAKKAGKNRVVIAD